MIFFPTLQGQFCKILFFSVPLLEVSEKSIFIKIEYSRKRRRIQSSPAFSERWKKMQRSAGVPVQTRVAAAFAFTFTFLTVVANCSINNSEVTKRPSLSLSLSLSLFASRENVGKNNSLNRRYSDKNFPGSSKIQISENFHFFFNDRQRAAEPALHRIVTVSLIQSFYYITCISWKKIGTLLMYLIDNFFFFFGIIVRCWDTIR